MEKLFKNRANMFLFGSVFAFTLNLVLQIPLAQAASVDLSPWRNPAGANTDTFPDIHLSHTPVDGYELLVSARIYNYGDADLDTSLNPVQVQLLGNGSNITTNRDATNDIITIDDGRIISAGSFIGVGWLWTPLLSNGTTQIQVILDPLNNIVESSEINNITMRDATVMATPLPPAVILFGTGLLGLMGFTRRKK